MGLTRSSSGLLVRDEFSSDTSGNYTHTNEAGSTDGSITGGYMVSPGDSTGSNRFRWVHNSSGGSKCATVLVDNATIATLGAVVLCQNADDVRDYYGYLNYGNKYVYRVADDSGTYLGAGGNTDTKPAYIRMYKTAAALVIKYGGSALADYFSVNDTTYASGLAGFKSVAYAKYSMFEARTAHTITCTGMATGHYLRVSDGTTAAEAQESSGTATVDAGAVLFPLATVQIRTASGGGGDLIAELDTGDYADMGGGDAFAYSADSALWLPNVMRHNTIGLGGLYG